VGVLERPGIFVSKRVGTLVVLLCDVRCCQWTLICRV